jgi:tyrosinase
MVVSLGPFGKIVNDIPSNPRADNYGSNPRCLRRDVNKYSAAVTFDNYTYSLITEHDRIEDFQANMLGNASRNDWGVHMGGWFMRDFPDVNRC